MICDSFVPKKNQSRKSRDLREFVDLKEKDQDWNKIRIDIASKVLCDIVREADPDKGPRRWANYAVVLANSLIAELQTEYEVPGYRPTQIEESLEIREFVDRVERVCQMLGDPDWFPDNPDSDDWWPDKHPELYDEVED